MKPDRIILSPLSAISPVDGRYHERTKSLTDYFSEYALIRYRLFTEIAWLKTLANCKDIPDIPPISEEGLAYLDGIFTAFGIPQAEQVKALELKLNHDVKAVEEYLRAEIKRHKELSNYSHVIHITCTSEDINSTAYALMIKSALNKVVLPLLDGLQQSLQKLAEDYAQVSLLALTHGQAATPTTLGKEFANFYHRLNTHISRIKETPITAKWNGASGNYNAHLTAWPDVDWPTIGTQHLQSIGIQSTMYTTQIEPHENLADLLNTLARCAQTQIDFSRDMWGYISRGVLTLKFNEQEVGSSTMPHKINPIDFENAEGNLGLVVALADHLSRKLVISRWQRDLSDSTTLRSLGSVFAHFVIALHSLHKACGKVAPNDIQISAELNQNYAVLGEAVQTVLRKHGVEDAYDRLKEISRGQELNAEILHKFIRSLSIPTAEKDALLALTPSTYTGLAERLAREVGKK